MSEVTSLGYWGIEATNTTAWQLFLVDQLGAAEAEAGNGLDGVDCYRIDSYAARIWIHEGPADDVAYVGWEVAGPSELATLRKRAEDAGHPVATGDDALMKARRVEGLIVLADPDGIRTEVFWGPAIAPREHRSPIMDGGFVGAPNGVGHHVIVVRDREKTLAFYRDVLGLRLSDYIRSVEPGRPALLVTFMHANSRHHSLAFAQVPFAPKRKLQHISFQVERMSDVGRAYDRILAAGTPVAMTLGHHPNCNSFSFYVRSPSGIDVEYSWGTLAIDDETWTPRTYSQLSDWGHKVGLDLIEAQDVVGI